MSSIKTKARRVGILYFLVMILAPINLAVSGRFIVPGDAGATARNIQASELVYRLNLVLGIAGSIVFLFVVLGLYDLLKDVDRKLARMMIVLISIGIAIGFVSSLIDFAPLVLLSGADFLAVFTRPQLEALAYTCLRLNSNGAAIAIAFWGLWLFPFGLLVIRSGYFPRLLGRLLIVGCFAYLALSFTIIVFPAQRAIVNQIAMPFYAVGEVSMILWLLIKGAKEPATRLQQSQGA